MSPVLEPAVCTNNEVEVTEPAGHGIQLPVDAADGGVELLDRRDSVGVNRERPLVLVLDVEEVAADAHVLTQHRAELLEVAVQGGAIGSCVDAELLRLVLDVLPELVPGT